MSKVISELPSDWFKVFNQSELKPKPIVARACTFLRALCRLHVITSSFDWFTGLSPSFLIGQSNYFGFGLRHSFENRSYVNKIIPIARTNSACACAQNYSNNLLGENDRVFKARSLH